MSVSVTYTSDVTVVETLSSSSTPSALEGNRRVTHTAYNTSLPLTSTTDVPATVVAGFNTALTSGSGSIDLTSMTGTNGVTVDATSLKVQIIKVRASSDNTGAVTLSEGASNGYELAGDSWSVALSPGQELLMYGNDKTPDVGASAKIIDLSGTGTDDVDVIVVAG